MKIPETSVPDAEATQVNSGSIDSTANQAIPVADNAEPTTQVAQGEPEYPNNNDTALDPVVRERERLAQEARQAYYFAREQNPDEYVKAEGIAKRTGIPLTSVLNSLNLATRIDDTRQINFDKMAEVFPGTSRFLSNPRNAAIAHDDVRDLTVVEGAVNALKYVVGVPGNEDKKRSLAGDILGSGASMIGGFGGFLSTYMDTISGAGGREANDIFHQSADQFARIYQWGHDNNEWLMPKSDSRVQNIVSSGIGSTAQNLALVPLLFTPAAPLALTGMAASQFGNTAMEDKALGKSHVESVVHGAWDGIWEYVGEKIGLSGLTKLAGGSGSAFLKGFGEFIGKEAFGEEVTNLMQSLGNWVARNPDKNINQFLDELGTSSVDTFFATLIGAGATTAVMKPVQSAVAAATRNVENAKSSEASIGAVDDLIRSVQATKTLQRDPESVKEFLDQQLQDGVKNVYIKGEMLAQSDLGQMLAQGSPEFAAAMKQAAEISVEVAVPIASLTTLPDVEVLAAPLADHFRVENEKFTRAEAQEVMATHEQSMQQEIERVLKDVQNADQFRTQIDEVKQVFVQQLDATGRYDSKANDVNATLVANFFGAQAARFGMTPMDLYKAYEYKVQSAGQTGDGYSQALLSAPPKGMVVGNGETASQIFNKVGDTRAVLFDNVTDKVALEIPDLAGFSHSFALSAVDHIIKNHGNVRTEKQRGQIAITSADTSRIPDIVSNYDSVHTGQTTRHGLPIIAYVKSYADGTIVYLEELRNKRKDLAGLTMWKYPATVDAQKIIKSFASDPNVQNVDGHDTILDQSGEDYKQGERGGFNPATFTTTLFKGADLSTFLHESGHFFLEMQMDMAAKLQKEAEAFGGVSTMTPGQQDMMRDTAALLKWFGVRDLTEWHGMTLDEKRVHHEQFARSFETYLYEGKAPSIELDSAFQTFRSWLANVYRAALDMVRGDMTKALDVKINDEVRGVMDRMLATTEQIKLAENARSMMPLFNSPQEAGMTQEEFAAYHLLSTDATLDAIQDLQARALRDMQWQRNAHGREVDRLKKLSESLRKQVRIEARAEILSQPVYRVYQFLTAKLSKEDKVEYKPLKSDPNHLDPGIDSLFVAIAKLGGLDRAEVESQWGWDKKERSPQAGIKYVLRSNGGLSIDAMAEKLVQNGYLSEDDPVRELEGRFDDEARGKPQYSNQVLPEVLNPPKTAGDTVNLSGLDAGRLELQDLAANGYTKEQIAVLTERGMTARDGLSADGVAALSQEFDSGDALIKALLEAEPLNDAIEGTTDRMMLERYGELATPEAIIQSADRAVYTDTRARAVAAEMTALEKALGPTEQTGTDKNGKPVKKRILPAAAKSFAHKMIARLTVRNLSPGLYTAAQTRAAKAAAQAMKKGDTATAAAEKRNELINLYAAKAAIEAQQELPKILDYFKKVQKPGTLPAEHYDQILNLLSKFDLRRSLTNRELDNRARFTTYVASQLAVGNIPPNIEKLLSERQLKSYEKEIQKRDENDNLIYADEDDQAKLLAQMIDESPVRSFKEMTVEEIRGLRDTIKQIEHMGRRTKKVLTDRQNREFDVVLGEMRDRLIAVATEKGRRATDNITANDLVGKAKLAWRGFFFSHIKAANLFHVMDGGDGGPIWDHLMSTANEAGANEAVEAGQSTDIVEKLLAPLRENGGRITGKKTSFPSIGRSLNKQSVLAMALNMGNESNQQRLLGGYGWTLDQIKPVLDTLTAADWHFVQGMWDHYESFRPRVGEMERTINGAEPNWIEARALQVHTADGQHLTLRGGYAPVIYDPRSSGKAQSHADANDAKAMMQAARVASTVQKSFTKARVEEVKGRPLMLALNPYLGSIQDTIHYLNWQPWIIDANRMISRLDPQMREYYGAEVVKQLRDWAGDNAAGMRAPRDGAEKGMAFISRNVSYVGLAYNAMSALKQITGITQSMAIVGSRWMMKGAARTIANPRQAYKDMIEKSAFMAKRASTQFRELNELNAIIQDKNQIADAIQKIGYRPMTIMQNFVDIPTWWGAYEKAVDAGNDDHRSVLLADQAVVDAQGSGMQKDLSSIERQQGAIRLLTGFMSYMNTTMNANYRLAKNADFKSVGGVADFTAGAALINIMPVLIGTVIAQAFTPSGGSDEDKLKKGLHKLGADQVSFMFGQLIGFRELQNIYDAFSGKPAGEYGGPTGMRLFGDILKLAKQVGQGVNDLALWKSIISAASDVLRLPGGQINRTLTGAHALATGKTNNPAALAFGFNAK